MWRRLKFYLELGVTGLCAASLASAGQTQPVDDQARTLPDDDSSPDPQYTRSELPVQQISRNAEPPYQNMFYTVGSAGHLEPKMGNLHIQMPNLFNAGYSFHAPFFQQQGAATNAEIQVGRFYYDITSLSASLLVSDNVDRSETGAKWGSISVINLRGIAYFQLLENLRFAANIGFVVLPFRGKFGIDGFVRDNANARLFFGDDEKLRAQLAYELELGNWNLLIYDEVRAREDLFAEHFNLNFSAGSEEEDREGRYVFRSPFGGGSQVRVNETDKRFTEAFIYAYNQAGATMSRVLPTETKLSIGGYRMDYMYLGGDQTFLPHSRDVGFITLRSERENLRFKPYVNYEIYRYDSQKWDQQIVGGVQGPLTENINLNAGVGWFLGGHVDRERLLAHVRIQHEINPHLSHALTYRREVTTPEQDLGETYTYSLHQILGPHLKADLFVGYATFEDLNNNMTGTEQWRGGLILSTDPSAKTSLRGGVIYARVKYQNLAQGEWDRWTGLLEARHRFTDTFEGRLLYQYQTRASTLVGDSYDENLMVLTVTKYFH